MSRILITGSSSGLGLQLARRLGASGHKVFHFDKASGHDVCKPGKKPAKIVGNNLDVLINCAGVNRINWLENVSSDDWDSVMDTNAKGIFLMAQSCLPMLLKSHGTILNIVSNAASVPMRCSLAYNASKGAALIMTKQLARELTSKGITVFSISPNKLRGTGMSNDIDRQVVKTRGWSIKQAQDYQKAGLLTGEETPVETVAEFITFLLRDKERHRFLSGCDLPYGA
jgi:NAD(P)-dependent dehydrogenase (short-subunit alcohol dehydrogenase family)